MNIASNKENRDMNTECKKWLCRICNMMQKLSNYLYIFPLSS
ncbi:hypothetical protein [Candidatus Bandiella euplotis]|nr:hypothetical protein [Candidatus Bandiella woodruffii]